MPMQQARRPIMPVASAWVNGPVAAAAAAGCVLLAAWCCVLLLGAAAARPHGSASKV
jgi:hypothetical protein